ncbi:hypothetical protein AVEN_122677-1, partial [Araneus ventricosus]
LRTAFPQRGCSSFRLGTSMKVWCWGPLQYPKLRRPYPNTRIQLNVTFITANYDSISRITVKSAQKIGG